VPSSVKRRGESSKKTIWFGSNEFAPKKQVNAKQVKGQITAMNGTEVVVIAIEFYGVLGVST
jgi:hypothetical protein